MLGDDLDHVDVRNELVEQTLQRHERAPHRGHRAGDLYAVPARHLRERGDERRQIEVGEVHGAELLHNAVEIAEQRRVVRPLHIGAGEAEQRVGEIR